ncbi:hypothetical protein BBJ28_00025395 [Nothophytophthora sp. Chile5]|nr:hypothetical protein BBJ28_00025395 [Nothophytophthora sp. Chile5]
MRTRSSAQKTGRPQDEIWVHFVIEREDGKKHGRCRYCSRLVKNGKPKGNLLKHLVDKCPHIPVEAHTKLKPVPTTAPLAGITSSSAVDPPPVASHGMSQDEFDLALAQVFFVCALPFVLVEAEVFKAFFARLTPGMVLPNRHRISGQLLVDATKRLQNKAIAAINERGHVSVVTDCWTDTNGSSIINFMVVAPGMPSLFWSSWSTRSERHTAKYMAREMERVINDIQAQTTATVVGIVTDNAKNMTSAWTAVMSKLPNVIGGGCSAHVLNLLMQDVCQYASIHSVYTRALAITRFVKEHLALLDEFKAIQTSARSLGARVRGLVLPVPTRWYSVHACLRNVQQSRDQLEELFLGSHYTEFRKRYQATPANRKKLAYIIAVIRDNNFWENLRSIIRLLDPMIEALRELESDKSYASSVYKWFRKLKYHEEYAVRSLEGERERCVHEEPDRQPLPMPEIRLDDEEVLSPVLAEAETLAGLSDAVPDHAPVAPLTAYKNLEPLATDDLRRFFRAKIQRRWEYVHTNAMGIAFFLDPTTDLDQFAEGDEEQTRNQACELAKRSQLFPENAGVPELVAELFKFANQKRRGGKDKRAMHSLTPPTDYWASEQLNFSTLGRLAEVVFSIPTSSAASERAWSIFDHIHTKKRNRLSVKKVEMLAYMYINYGTTKGETIDLARHQSRPESIELEDAPATA